MNNRPDHAPDELHDELDPPNESPEALEERRLAIANATAAAEQACLVADRAVAHVSHVRWATFAAAMDANVWRNVAAAVAALPANATAQEIAAAEWTACAGAKATLAIELQESLPTVEMEVIDALTAVEEKKKALRALQPRSLLDSQWFGALAGCAIGSLFGSFMSRKGADRGTP